MRRLVCQYGRAQNTVFPTGRDHKGGEYGSDVNFAVSSDERNNPKFTGCIDRSA
jgi:starch-binding outer membrane protein, SusD/RagB family